MGFLSWFQQQPSESDSQLDLFGTSKELLKHERVDTATVYKDFQQSMIDKAVSPEGRRRAVVAETQTLFDCTIDELYQGTGGKKGDRSSLPKEAQKAYMVNEVISTNRIKESQFGGNQRHRDDQVVETVQETAQQTRKWFPW
jgi:hypothetical protein